MSNRRSSSPTFMGLFFFLFVLFKAAGHAYIATWSWWWLLLPAVPVWAGVLHYFGVL